MKRCVPMWVASRAVVALCAAVGFGGLLSGCESLPVKVNNLLPNSMGPGSSIKVGQLPPAPPERQWPDAAQDVRDQRAQGYGLVQLPHMQAYLNGLLAKIKQGAGVPHWPGAVYITAVSELDAYCTGAGNIYLSLGWLESAESEDEIVALLAHEFGHVYLNAHQLGTAVTTGDQAAKWTAVGVALAKKTGNVAGWSVVDSLLLSYEAGKSTLAPAWGRKEEEWADSFGATLSLQLNYSFSRGFKTFLERQATWETQNAQRRESEKQQLLASLKQASEEQLRKQNAGPKNGAQEALQEMQIALNGGVVEASQGIGNALKDALRTITQMHPDTEARLTALTAQVVPLMEGRPRPAATIEPWRRALAQPQTAAVLKNYRLATEAQGALQLQDHATARKLALAAATGPTAGHALPVMLVSLTEGHASADENRKRREPVGLAIDPLDRNLRSEPDRAWHIYALRANRLLSAGQAGQAKAVISDGLDYFGNSPAVWPDVIRFTAQTQGWPSAKQLAQTCANRFPSHNTACLQAAQSPEDIAATERRTEQKAKSLTDKWFKKTR